MTRTRLAAPIVGMYWLMLVAGLVFYSAIRIDDARAVLPLWIGALGGTALGQFLALRDYRLWVTIALVVGVLTWCVPVMPPEISSTDLWMANDTYDELIADAITPSVTITAQRLLGGSRLEHATVSEWGFSTLARSFGPPTACVAAWERNTSGDINHLDDLPTQIPLLASRGIEWDQVLWVQNGHGTFYYNRDPSVVQEGPTTTVAFPISVVRLQHHQPGATLITISDSFSLSLPTAARQSLRGR